MGQITGINRAEKAGVEPRVQPAPAGPQANPSRIFQTMNAFQQSAALRAAIELDIFTAIDEGLTKVPQIAQRANAAERGIRILCDYMALLGFLKKSGTDYALAQDAAVFLNRRSPAYMGVAARFLNAPELMDAYKDFAAAVRKGGTVLSGQGSVEPENPIWVEFARSMAPMMMMPAQMIAKIVCGDSPQKAKILDIAAGHGLFGIMIARHNPLAEIVALDWPQVLEVAKENAHKAGVEARYATLPGSAFEVAYGEGYDLVLLTNFLHHFDPATCEGLLRKTHACLKPGGRVVLLEFVPNDDRVTPPEVAFFSVIMLASTPSGDAYTFEEYKRMFANSGFRNAELVHLDQMPESVIIGTK